MQDEIEPVVPIDILKVTTSVSFRRTVWSEVDARWVYRRGVTGVSRENRCGDNAVTPRIDAVRKRAGFDVHYHGNRPSRRRPLVDSHINDGTPIAIAVKDTRIAVKITRGQDRSTVHSNIDAR